MAKGKMQSCVVVGIVMFVFILTSNGTAQAKFQEGKCEDYKLHLNATSDDYWKRSGSRLLNGILNVCFGWTQLFLEPMRSVRSEDEDIVTALAEGAAATTTFMAAGGWEGMSFWLPGEGGKELAFKDSVFCHMNGS